MEKRFTKVWFVVMHLGISLLCLAGIFARMDGQLTGLSYVVASIGVYGLWSAIVASWLYLAWHRIFKPAPPGQGEGE